MRIAALCSGFAASLPGVIAAGGAVLAAAALTVTANLSLTPLRMLRSSRPQPGAAVPAQTADAETASGPRASITLSLVAIAAAAIAVILAAAALWSGQAADAGSAATTRVLPNGATKSLTVELGDMFVRPSAVFVPSGTRLALQVVNRGDMSHDLQLEGGDVGTGLPAPGQRATVDYGVVGHAEQAWCTVPGHKAAGMLLNIHVAGSAQPAAQAGHAGCDAVIPAGETSAPWWRPQRRLVRCTG